MRAPAVQWVVVFTVLGIGAWVVYPAIDPFQPEPIREQTGLMGLRQEIFGQAMPHKGLDPRPKAESLASATSPVPQRRLRRSCSRFTSTEPTNTRPVIWQESSGMASKPFNELDRDDADGERDCAQGRDGQTMFRGRSLRFVDHAVVHGSDL